MIALLAAIVLQSQLNPEVTQATIQQTICQAGYAKTVRARHPASYYYAIKRKLLHYQSTRGWVLDHKVAIEDGGSPDDPANMQIQSLADSKRKDDLENRLHAEICGGSVMLRDAQEQLNDWTP